MAFFKSKKKTTTEDPVVEESVVNAGDDRQRVKNIKNMKRKFEETVWSSALETMKQDIPKFVIVEKDPDDPELQITKYVCLGFDTKIVNNFTAKDDDDVGSMMTAIKSSMDVVIESGLFDNEMILFIPTAKTLDAIKEFEESFELRFSIVYCYDDHKMQVETIHNSSELIYVTLDDIRDMLNNNLSIKDMIKSKQFGAMVSDDFSETDETSSNNDVEYIEDEESEDTNDFAGADREEEIPDESEDEPEIPNEPDVSEIPNEPDVPEEPEKFDVPEEIPAEEPVVQETKSETTSNIGETKGAVSDAVASASEKLNKLKSAVQSASDDALNDEQIKSSKINLNPDTKVPAFDMSQMDQYITRRYYSDELDLEISSQPFDAMFLQSNMYTEFAEVEGDGWLAGYVNNLRKDANTRLAKLHQENLQIMRERYMLIISKHCENIIKAVALDDPKARFGFALKTITKIKNDSLASLSETAEAYKRDKENDYQERMKVEMVNASNTAKANFINKYAKEHERELREIEQDLRNNIESEYIAARDNLQAERKDEARRQLDVGISEALAICADEYTKMLAIERKEYMRLQALITDFQNENMASEEARINVLAEELRRKNEVNEIRTEYDVKFDTATKDFEAKFAAVKAEIDRVNIDHENYIKELNNRHDKDLQDLRDRHSEQMELKEKEINTLNDQLSNANRQIDILTVKYANLDEEVAGKYANQIDMLKSEREAWEERASHVEHLHKYTDRIKVTLMIVGMAAALGIGVIIGCAVMSSKNSETKAPVVHYYEDESTTSDKTESESESITDMIDEAMTDLKDTSKDVEETTEVTEDVTEDELETEAENQ